MLVLGFYIQLVPIDPTPADGASFILASYRLGQPHLPSPIYTILGFLFTKLPWGSITGRVVLLSAISGALSVALVYWFVQKFLISILSADKRGQIFAQIWAILTALFLAFSDRFWNALSTAEQYALNVLAVLSVLLLTMKWSASGNIRWLYTATLIYALSLGLHSLNIYYFPALVLFILTSKHRKRVLRFWPIVIMAILFCVGLLQYLYVVLRPIGPFSYITSLGSYWDILVYPQIQYLFGESAFLENFSLSRIIEVFSVSLRFGFWTGLVTHIMAIIGMFGLWKYSRRITLFLLAIFLIGRLATIPAVGLSYGRANLEFWLLPSTVIMAVFVGASAVVFHRVIGRFKSLLQAKAQTIKSLPSLLRYSIDHVQSIAITALSLCLAFLAWNNYVSNRGHRIYEKKAASDLKTYSRTLLELASPSGTILTDWTFATLLFYYQEVENINPEISIICIWPEEWPDYANDLGTSKPVYIAHAHSEDLEELDVTKLFRYSQWDAYEVNF